MEDKTEEPFGYTLPDLNGVEPFRSVEVNQYDGHIEQKYDYTEEFNRDIKLSIEKVGKWCADKHIPMIFSVGLIRSGNTTKCLTSTILPNPEEQPAELKAAAACLADFDNFLDYIKQSILEHMLEQMQDVIKDQ